MKYKVGDKARVRTDLTEDERYGGVTVADEMVDMRGMTVTIEDVDESGYGINEDPEGYTWTDEMFEPVEEELTAEEAIRLKGEMCTGKLCNNCKLSSKNNGMGIACNELEKKHPERAIEILKQYKKDHEKKEVEVEFVDVIRIIEDTGDIKRCVHEERIDVEFVKISADIKRVLKDWCKDHDGEFFAVMESRCVVKE